MLPNPAKTAVKAIAIGLAVIGLIWLILFITKGRFLERPFEILASRIVGREVRVGGDFQLYSNPHIKFRAQSLLIANQTWAEHDNFVDAHLVDLRIDVLRLIFGKILFREATLEDATFALEWDEKGNHNTWTFGDDGGEPFHVPEIRTASFAGTSLIYRDPPRRLFTTIAFAPVEARSSRFERGIGFRGNGTSMEAPFRVSGRLDSPNATIAGGHNALAMRIDVGDSRIDVTGTLPGVTQLDGANLNVRGRGGNLATPFQLLAVAVPDTRRFDLRGALRPRGNEWHLTNISGTFGDSDLSGRMTIRTGADRLFIEADLASRSLDILDAGPWIGLSPERLDRLGGAGAITSENGRPRVLPDGRLDAEGLGRLDAKVIYRAVSVRTGTVPLQNLTLDLQLNQRLLTLKPVRFDLAGGTLTAEIDVNARRSPVVTRYDIRLTPVRIAELLRGFDIASSGTDGVMRGRLRLVGHGNSVRESLGTAGGRVAFVLPRGNLWLRNAELIELDIGDFIEAALGDQLKEPTRIRCGLVAFTFKQGIGRADPILIDTSKNVIRGEGGISLKDESLDLSMKADAKNPSLFSGQSPISINGWFAQPSINPLSGELAGRAAIGGVLGIALSPLAALLAFVDVGGAEDTNCTAILSSASASQVRTAEKKDKAER